MKLIIDIDEDYVKIINKNGASNYPEEVIKNGTPLDDVLDKIRAEIEQMIAESEKAIRPFDGMEVVIYTKGFKDGTGSAIDVIDKYREGEEE